MRGPRTGSGNTARNLLFAALASAIFTWAIPVFFLMAQFSPWDFIVFWGAGQALNAGLDPYQINVAQIPGRPVPFFSPIFIAEFFRPVAALVPSVMEAKLIWTAINVVGGAALCIILVRLSGLRMRARSIILAAALLVSFEPFFAVMALGQTDILIVLAVAGSWLLIESRRLFLAGLVFCVGASNPHLILGVGVYYLYRALVRRELRLLLGMGTGALGLVLSSALYPAYSVEWLTRVLPATQVTTAHDPLQITLIQLTATYSSIAGLSPGQGVRLGSLVTIVIAALSLIAAVMVWRRGASMAIDMSAAVVLSLVATTYAFHQDYTVLALLGPSLVTVWRETGSIRRVSYLVVCGATLLFSSIPGLFGFGEPNYWLSVYNGWPLLTGALALSQLSMRPALLRQALPSAGLLLALTFMGDFLTLIDLTWMRALDVTLILLGLLGYLFAIWLWYGRPSPTKDVRDETGVSVDATTVAEWQ